MNPLIELNHSPDTPTPTPPAPAALLPPTPEQVDEMIAEYFGAQELARAADAVLDDVKKRLVFTVDSFGQVPPHAEQSRRLVGKHNLATVTRGTTITVNEDAVQMFKAYLAERSYSDLFLRFFAPHEKHALVEGARDVLKTLTLPRRVEEKIAALFGKAFDVKPKSPSLKVEIIKPEKPAKKPRGKQAA